MSREKSNIETDWQLFKRHIPKWREHYLAIKNKEIVSILTDENKTPTEQFWNAKDKIFKISKILCDCFDDLSRSEMIYKLLYMYNYGVISKDNLVEFSDELKEKLYTMLNIKEN